MFQKEASQRLSHGRLSMLIVCLCAAAGAAPTPAQQGPAPAAAFVDVAVIPMDSERVLTHQTVVVQGDRIVALGPAKQVQPPAGAQQIDGRGKYLIPGLGDMHVHDVKPDSLLLLRYLADGVTTVRDMHSGGSDSPQLRAKRAVASGALLGPHIYTAGDPLDVLTYGTAAPYQWLAGDSSQRALGSRHGFSYAALADSIAALKRAGHEYIKQYGWGLPVYDSVVVATRHVGLPIAGHVPTEPQDPAAPWDENTAARSNLLEHVLRDRWASIEHLTGYLAYLTGLPEVVQQEGSFFEQVIDTAAWMKPGFRWDTTMKLRKIAVATRQAGVWNAPTMFTDCLKTMTFSGAQDAWAARVPQIYGQIIKALHQAGAGLVLGTDGPMAVDALRMVVQDAELTPYQALAMGTRNIAAFLGTLDSTGTVAVGKRADLVLLERNPLQDIRAVYVRTGVMIGGKWLPQVELEARLRASPLPRLAGCRPLDADPPP